MSVLHEIEKKTYRPEPIRKKRSLTQEESEILENAEAYGDMLLSGITKVLEGAKKKNLNVSYIGERYAELASQRLDRNETNAMELYERDWNEEPLLTDNSQV